MNKIQNPWKIPTKLTPRVNYCWVYLHIPCIHTSFFLCKHLFLVWALESSLLRARFVWWAAKSKKVLSLSAWVPKWLEESEHSCCLGWASSKLSFLSPGDVGVLCYRSVTGQSWMVSYERNIHGNLPGETMWPLLLYCHGDINREVFVFLIFVSLTEDIETAFKNYCRDGTDLDMG